MKFEKSFNDPESRDKYEMEQVLTSLEEEVDAPLNNPEVLESLGNLSLEVEKKSEAYEVLISDEASGRIPALIFRKIINRSRKDKGLEPIDFRAVAGGNNLSQGKKSAVSQLLDQIIEDHDESVKRVLLVTEYIQTGRGLGWLTDLLEEKKVDFDIASVSVSGIKDYFPPSISNHLLPGTKRGMSGIYLYNEYERSGTYKNTDNETPFPEKYAKANQEKIKKTREDIDKIANNFYSVIESRRQRE